MILLFGSFYKEILKESVSNYLYFLKDISYPCKCHYNGTVKQAKI